MGRNKGAHYQCINKRKRNREGMARARQVLKERTFNQLDTTSSSTMSVEVDVGTVRFSVLSPSAGQRPPLFTSKPR